MKRLLLILGAIVAVVTVVVALAVFMVLPARDSGNEPVAGLSPTEEQNLPALPVLEGMSHGGMGGGGGGGDGTSDAYGEAVQETMVVGRDWQPVNVFSGTQFVLNVSLPAELGPSMVLQQQPWVMDVATARQLADQWGFTGPLYLIPQPELPEGEMAYVMPPTYFVFDGKRMLQLDAQFGYYNDGNIVLDYENPTAYEQARPVAENFLQSRGLLNFPYEVRQGYMSNEVHFYRLVDGRPVNQPEIWVNVAGDQVASISYSAMRAPAELGNYPLISAEQAWQNLLQQAALDGQLMYELMPADMGVYEEPVFVDGDMGQPQYWQRVYHIGEEVHLYTWPTIYQPAEGDAAPRVETYPLTLQASDELLRAIGSSGSQMFHFWGIVGNDGKSLEVAGYEAMGPDANQSIFIEGVIKHEGDLVLVTALDGATYIIPNAPAEVTDGLEVSVFAFASREIGAAYPVLEWDNVSERVIYPEEPVIEQPIDPAIEEPMMWQPFIYQGVTVDKAELAYYYSYVFDEAAIERGEYSPATILVQPVWKFSGTADNGDQMTFYVQAVAAEHLEATN